MTEQGKTLGQLNVQPGDVVRCVNDGGRSWWTVGKEYHVYESEDGLIIKDDDDARWLNTSALFTIVSRNEVNPSQDGASIPPADPAPVTWPDGVTEMRFGACGRHNITIAGGYISINDRTLAFRPTEASQLAFLLIAAANHVEGK